MNFRNTRQHEVQSAFWECSQTAIHVIINIYPCTNGCGGNIIHTVCQITDDLLHDSFVTRAAHNANFRLLAEKGIPMDYVFQFCDNCASQYKSRRPFVELARNPLNIIRVYFGERHGKNMCDGFFGRLKAWMTYNIKTGNAVISNAYDFFLFCRNKYREPKEGICDHNPVEFQYLTAQDIGRNNDIDLEKSIPGTRSIYSVKNTPDPQILKIRNIACLCTACVKDNGNRCKNYRHVDPWREVKLQTSTDLCKMPHPRNDLQQTRTDSSPVLFDTQEDMFEMPEVIIHEFEDEMQKEDAQIIDLDSVSKQIDEGTGEIYVDLTVAQGDDVTIWSDDDEEVITIQENEHLIHTEEDFVADESIVPRFEGIEKEDVPEDILWESYLSALEGCRTFESLKMMCTEIKKRLPELCERALDVHFDPQTDFIDRTAKNVIPPDCSLDVDPIWILADGNCLPRALSRCYWGHERGHEEIRTRIIIEGVLNKDQYLSPFVLNNGASHIRVYEPINITYAKYSDYYLSGQVMTVDTVDYMYCREMYNCATKNTYMGLWQIHQAANVLRVPILSVYPVGGDKIMRKDFNRICYPFGLEEAEVEPIKILWTSTRKTHVPNHFVSLVPKNKMYE